MKISSRAAVAWAITVFVVIGAVFILITMIRGDDTDMERQPVDSSSSLVGAAATTGAAA